MEWLRSCYRSSRRLFNDRPDVITTGAYYRSRPEAPFLPYPHYLGSLNWVRNTEFFVTGPLGELAEPVGEWTSGVWRGPLPLPKIIGTSECFTSGERYPLNIVPSVYGMPARCYRMRPANIPIAGDSFNIEAPNVQLLAAQILSWLYSDPDSIAAFFAAWLGPLASVTVVPNSNSLIPGSVIIQTANWTMVVVSGTSNPQQLALQMISGAVPWQNYGIYGTVPLWHTASQVMLNRMAAAGVNPDLPLIITGHSYGGAVATLVAARLIAADPTRNIQLLTFGSPSAGDGRVDALLGNLVRRIHLANAGDPVPGLPPTRLELGNLALLIPSPLLTAWNRFQQMRYRQVLNADGTISPWTDSPLDRAFLLAMVAAILAGRPMAPFNAHNIDVYLERLRLVQPVPPKFPINQEAAALLVPSNNLNIVAALNWKLFANMGGP